MHGKLLRFYRMIHSISQAELAQRCNRNQHWVSQIELGYRVPTDAELAEIAGALGLTPGHLGVSTTGAEVRSAASELVKLYIREAVHEAG